MKIRKNPTETILPAILLATLALPLTILPTFAENKETPVTLKTEEGWTYIQNDKITIMFPADGAKPMFLWWNTEDTNHINVVKYKGLIEYVTYNQSHFVWKNRAEAKIIRSHVYDHYMEIALRTMREHPTCYTAWGTWHIHAEAIEKTLTTFENQTSFHEPYLPFSSCRWKLSPITEAIEDNAKYLGFNFTLVSVPDHMKENLQFAENNIAIRCRFYYTPLTESVEGRYTYTVDSSELKMDLIVKQWNWNIDRLDPFLPELNIHMVGTPHVPSGKASLALWVNLVSINRTALETAKNDIAPTKDTNFTEEISTASDFHVEGEQISVTQNRTDIEDEQTLQSHTRERYKFRFERGSATLAGFFKFMPRALFKDPATNTTVNAIDATASYISGGGHMRVFINYPYFANNALEHDPSLGLEVPPTLIEPPLLIVLLITTTIITVAVVVTRLRRRNITFPQITMQ